MAARTAPTQDRFATMVGRLNKLSVEKHFDAYADVDWDAPGYGLDAADARLKLPDFEPVTATRWYRDLPEEKQSEYGLYRYAACMKTGWHFENLLQRGLLAFAFRQKNGSDAFRYVHHEIIEESQHTLMFQEYVNRSGLPVRGMRKRDRFLAELAVEPIVKRDPALFFVFVLGGEEPADYLQKQLLRNGVQHPLLERIMRIHVTEEARHLSFARHYLMREIPEAGRFRRRVLSIAAPIILGEMARMMTFPPSDLREHLGMPKEVALNAFRSPDGRRMLRESVAATRNLCVDLGLVNRFTRPIWRAYGVWGEPGDAKAEAAPERDASAVAA